MGERRFSMNKKELRETIKLLFGIFIAIGGCYLADFTSNWILSIIVK